MKRVDYILFLLVVGVILLLFFLLYPSNKSIKNIKLLSINIDKAYILYEKKTAIFIDARYYKFYNKERIKGALSFPLQRYNNWKEQIIKQIKPHQIIIVYCDNRLCSLSYYLVKKITELGYTNVYKLLGGLDQWKKKGYPIHSSL